MARISSQHRGRDVEVEFGSLDGGIDYSVPPHSLPDNVLYEATNLFYDIDSGRLMTRPGLVRVTTSALNAALVSVYPCTVQGVRRIIVASDEPKLYYLDGTSLTLIGSLNGSSSPQFEVFKEDLYIASGGSLQKWDGTTLSDVGAAPSCTLLAVKSARLFVNDTSDPDVIKASGVQDDTTFSYPGGATFQAGWGDGDSVVGMQVFGDDLVVFKGQKTKSVHILKGVYPDWALVEIGRGTSIVGANAVIKIGSFIFGLDTDGLNDLRTVEAYGDFKSDPLGGPVVGPLTRQVSPTAFMAGWPERSLLMVFPSQDLATAYALHYSTSDLVPKARWTRFRFEVGRISSAAYDTVGDILYLTSMNGHLYTMKMEVLAEANTFTDDGTDIPQAFRTKIIDPRGSQILHKRSRFFFEALADGAGTFYCFTQDGTWPQLSADFTIDPRTIDDFGDTYIDDMLMPVGMSDRSTVVRLNDRCRDNNLMLGATISSGALSISRLDIDAAVVGRE